MISLEPNTPTEPVTERHIVDIRDGIKPKLAFTLVLNVIGDGRRSHTRGIKHHCHHTGFTVDGVKLHVACILNRKSERFVVYKEQRPA